MSKGDFDREIRDKEASTWMWRIDRELTAKEQDSFFDWLAKNPENSNALAKYDRSWKRMDKLSEWLPEHSEKPNPDLLAPSNPSKKFRIFTYAVAACLSLAAIIWFTLSKEESVPKPESGIAEVENRTTLADGSVVKLKDDAEMAVLYSAQERRVGLEMGEAFFMVARDPDRPFVVEVQGSEVSAVGTAFNVRIGSDFFEVLVSEGQVQVDSAGRYYDGPTAKPVLEASQRARISLSDLPETPAIATLTRGEIHRVLAWQHGLMTFSSKPLSEIAYELNHFNETQLIVLDEELAQSRFSGSFRSDNMKGFVRLLEAAFGAKAEWNGEFEILLGKESD